ncbi:hypothetical protein L3Q82_014944, partial [Scortum barcoo]
PIVPHLSLENDKQDDSYEQISIRNECEALRTHRTVRHEPGSPQFSGLQLYLVLLMDCVEQKESEEKAPSVVDRYYTRWYRADMKAKPCEDHCILQHSNRICVVTLAHTHPILQGGRTIKSINYQISNGCSRLNNKVSGKSKRGGQFLTDFAPLCRITCTDETEYTIYSCIRGRLLEVNENILETPSLLLEKPSTDGYIAVILPKFEESKSITENLLNIEEFESLVSKRTVAQSQTS